VSDRFELNNHHCPFPQVLEIRRSNFWLFHHSFNFFLLLFLSPPLYIYPLPSYKQFPPLHATYLPPPGAVYLLNVFFVLPLFFFFRSTSHASRLFGIANFWFLSISFNSRCSSFLALSSSSCFCKLSSSSFWCFSSSNRLCSSSNFWSWIFFSSSLILRASASSFSFRSLPLLPLFFPIFLLFLFLFPSLF